VPDGFVLWVSLLRLESPGGVGFSRRSSSFSR
jgi:hypothetical protein